MSETAFADQDLRGCAHDVVVVEHPDIENVENRAATVSNECLVAGLTLIWIQRRRLALFTLLGAAAAAIIAFSVPARFQATTRFLPDGYASNSDPSQSESLLVEILTSRTIQDRLIAKFQLKRIYNVRQEDEARAKLVRNTVVEGSENGIISVTVTDKEPQRAADLCNAYGAELNRMMSQLSMDSVRPERLFLEDRVKAAKQELNSEAKALSEFASKNGVTDIKQQTQIMFDSGISLRKRIISERSELEALKQVYAANNPRIKELSAEILELQKGIDDTVDRARTTSYASSPAKRSISSSIRKLGLLNLAYSDLSRDAALRESDYQTLGVLSEAAKVAESRDTPSIAILDSAVVPERRVRPPLILITFLGAAISATAAIFWIFSRGRRAWRENNELTLPENVLRARVS